MSDREDREIDELGQDSQLAATTADQEETPRLEMDVKIEKRSTCERHITVTVSHDDVERFFDKEFSDLMPTAHVPGFRPGRAPRKLVEARFRKEIADKVKSELIMACLSQIDEEQKLSTISEPEFDFDAIKIPDEGPMTFEFDVEVRPEFELPKWKGLVIEKPVREITDADVAEMLQRVLARHGQLVPHEGPAEAGDYVTVNLTIKHGDRVLTSAKEEVIRIRPVLSFHDGKLEGFDKLMVGVCAGQTREGEVQLSNDAPNVELQGQKVKAIFEVLEVKRLRLPELTKQFLEELGGFRDEAELKDAVRDQIVRQMEYEQRRRARQQITSLLTEAANWELPPALLRRQSHRELQRLVMELRSSGFSEEEILAHENSLRQNSMASTAVALKEHFILERIAEEEGIEATEEDYEEEIRLIAAQSDESPRRVRAKIEKSGSMDVLRNQIIERKTLAKILEHATFKEVPYQLPRLDEAAVYFAAGGREEADIPEARHDEGEAVPEARGEDEQNK